MFEKILFEHLDRKSGLEKPRFRHNFTTVLATPIIFKFLKNFFFGNEK